MGDVLYAPLIEDMTWSYSRANCFEDCRYKWFLKYICNDKEELLFYSSYGKFMHKLLESFYKGNISKEEMKIKFLCEFSNKVKGERPSDKIVASYIEKGLDYINNFEEFPYEMVAVEDRIEFDINGIPFVGVIDYIGKDDDGYIIIDHKSRELKPRSKNGKHRKSDDIIDDMMKQLYIYSEAVRQKYGEFPKKLCFNCFKNQVFIEEDFDPKKFEDSISWLKETIEDIKASTDEDFYPNIDFFVCKYLCGYSNECCYVDN